MMMMMWCVYQVSRSLVFFNRAILFKAYNDHLPKKICDFGSTFAL